MSTKENWFAVNDGFVATEFEKTYGISGIDCAWLFDTIENPNALTSFFKKIEDWLTGLVYIPIDLKKALPSGDNDTLFIGETQTAIYGAPLLETFAYSMFYMGSFKSQNNNTSFLDYEPYKKCRVYLPYYGYTEIPMKYVNKYNIGFWLHIDYKTGQAMYYICGYNTTPTLKSSSIFPYIENVNNAEPEIIISTLAFQLGFNIPLNNSGASDRLRNVTLSIMKTASSIAIGTVSASFGMPYTGGIPFDVSEPKLLTGNVPKQIANPTRYEIGGNVPINMDVPPNRLPNKGYDLSADVKINSASSIKEGLINTRNQALEVMRLNPDTEKVQNALLNNMGSHSIHCIIETVKTYQIPDEFSAKPFANTAILSDLCGLTEINTVIMEGFEGTEKEKMSIISLLETPVILRNYGTVEFTISHLNKTYYYSYDSKITFNDLAVINSDFEIINNKVTFRNVFLRCNNIIVKGTDYVNNSKYTTGEYVKFETIIFSIIFEDTTKVYRIEKPVGSNYTFEDFVEYQNYLGITNFNIVGNYVYYNSNHILISNTNARKDDIITNNSTYIVYGYYGESIKIKTTFDDNVIEINQTPELVNWDYYINLYPNKFGTITINNNIYVYSKQYEFLNDHWYRKNPNIIVSHNIIYYNNTPQKITDTVFVERQYFVGYAPDLSNPKYYRYIELHNDTFDIDGKMIYPSTYNTWRDWISGDINYSLLTEPSPNGKYLGFGYYSYQQNTVCFRETDRDDDVYFESFLYFEYPEPQGEVLSDDLIIPYGYYLSQ